ncbi:MAG TPA: WD40 repeat domain-containing serine/threonine protein kinase [Vicinamibacterales bacterium]|nr:WD40 repeat domain-containing serine/threonine protein kinase [Vicinamibacterales bacterium]
MGLAPGTRLGTYEIVDVIGSGGMGEVYRARDTKLDRPVAIKVLPELFVADPDRVARFEREAKSLAALNHPNILAIHDFGVSGGTTYAAMELLEGQALRDRLAGGPLPPRKAADYAAQIARGLAAAHDRGIVHRDLKPENIVVSPDGRVKILDFGLALQVGVAASLASDVTRARTDAGMVLGTMGYMSPEQVRGEPVDFRSDIFSLGSVLYEMLSGRRAFARDTAAETMTAILRDDPPELPGGGDMPLSLRGIVQHCLEKAPAERFQSARDLAFALEQVVASGSGARQVVHAGAPSRRFRALPAALLLGALVAGAALGFGVGRSASGTRVAHPKFTRLTFGRGTIRNARFAPDGQTVVYGAAWDNAPLAVYLARTDSPDSTPLPLPSAELQGISAQGELAVTLAHEYQGWVGEGTLARAPLLAGGARPILERVREADWLPDGSDLAIVRRVNGRERLEFPAGHVLYESTGFISNIRFAPDGQRIAFADHPVFADDLGGISVVDRAGNRTVVWTGQDSVRGVAWTPDGREVWFTTNQGTDSMIRAATLTGQNRVVHTTLKRATIFDIAPDGRVLLGDENHLRHVEAITPESPAAPRDYSLPREQSVGRTISADGRFIAITDQTFRGYTTYVQRTDGSAPVRVGRGDALELSPDGRLIMSVTSAPPMRLLLHPLGPGSTRELVNPEEIVIENARWLPDNSRVVIFGPTARTRGRVFVQSVAGGAPVAFTPEGVTSPTWWAAAVSPDGARVTARGPDGVIALWNLAGGAPQPLPNLAADYVPIAWSTDGRSLVVARRIRPGWSIALFEIATGRVQPVRDIVANEASGLRGTFVVATPDAKYVVHSYSRLLVDLYVAEGLK